MKILFINSVCGIRSTGRICSDIASQYELEGNTARIAYGREMASDGSKVISYRIGNVIDNYYHALVAKVFDKDGQCSRIATRKFIRWAERYNPDVVWIHNLHGYYINYELLFKWIKSRPNMKVLWTLHDCWAFTGGCTHFVLANCNQWENMCIKCPTKCSFTKNALFRRTKSNYCLKKELFTGIKDMTIITPSQWLADLVKLSFLKDYPIEVRNNTIDLCSFHEQKSNIKERMGLNKKKIILGVQTGWSKEKGLFDFIKVADMLSDEYAVVLVGLTDKQIKRLPGSVIGLPRTNSVRELAELYSASDVFLNLTYEDNYPTVNLEAQACGTPCVTYRTGGSPESVPIDNVVEVGDLQGIIQRIYQICQSKS